MKRVAKQIMTEELITIDWSEPMSAAADRMEESKIRHLAVTDGSGELVGILSDRDVQRAMKPIISIDDAGQGMYSEVDEFDPQAKVRHFMSWPPRVVPATADLREVAARMVTEKISSLLVVDGKRHIGIITTEDLLKVLMAVLSQSDLKLDMDMRTLLQKARSHA